MILRKTHLFILIFIGKRTFLAAEIVGKRTFLVLIFIGKRTFDLKIYYICTN